MGTLIAIALAALLVALCRRLASSPSRPQQRPLGGPRSAGPRRRHHRASAAPNQPNAGPDRGPAPPPPIPALQGNGEPERRAPLLATLTAATTPTMVALLIIGFLGLGARPTGHPAMHTRGPGSSAGSEAAPLPGQPEMITSTTTPVAGSAAIAPAARRPATSPGQIPGGEGGGLTSILPVTRSGPPVLRVPPPPPLPPEGPEPSPTPAAAERVEILELPDELAEVLTPEAQAAETELLKRIFAADTIPQYEDVWQWPVPEGTPVGDRFGELRSAGDGTPVREHSGTDFLANGGTPVVAVNNGTVVLVETLTIRGNTVVIDHGGAIFTVYAHLESVEVKAGDVVRAGDLLGTVGSTGITTGPHLHWELALEGAFADGLLWLPEPE